MLLCAQTDWVLASNHDNEWAAGYGGQILRFLQDNRVVIIHKSYELAMPRVETLGSENEEESKQRS